MRDGRCLHIADVTAMTTTPLSDIDTDTPILDVRVPRFIDGEEASLGEMIAIYALPDLHT